MIDDIQYLFNRIEQLKLQEEEKKCRNNIYASNYEEYMWCIYNNYLHEYTLISINCHITILEDTEKNDRRNIVSTWLSEYLCQYRINEFITLEYKIRNNLQETAHREFTESMVKIFPDKFINACMSHAYVYSILGYSFDDIALCTIFLFLVLFFVSLILVTGCSFEV